MAWVNSYTYGICGSDRATHSPRAIRVSVQSLQPTEIVTGESHSVILKVENSGHAPVVLPVSQDIAIIAKEDTAIHYRAMYWVNGETPSRPLLLGWMGLYGSSADPTTLLTLSPGEWIILHGDIYPRRLSATEQNARAYADLQFYVRDTLIPSTVAVECIKQDSGATFPIHYPGVPGNH